MQGQRSRQTLSSRNDRHQSLQFERLFLKPVVSHSRPQFLMKIRSIENGSPPSLRLKIRHCLRWRFAVSESSTRQPFRIHSDSPSSSGVSN